MSLIHDALKKAHKEAKDQVGSGAVNLQDTIEEGAKPKTNKRTIILAVVMVIALAYFAYSKLYSPMDAPDAPTPKGAAGADVTGTEATPIAGPTDAAGLKRRAYDSYRADDLGGAWANISAAVKLAPDDAEAWNNLGLIAKERGDSVKAREAYDKALELKPNYAEALNNLAVLEWQEGNGAKARELLEKALLDTPAYAEANFNMALIYDKAGNKEQAKDYYLRFLEVGGSFPSNVVEEVRDRVMELEK